MLAGFKRWAPWAAGLFTLIAAGFILAPIVAVVVYVGVVLQPFTVPAASMSPTINRSDYLFARKLPPRAPVRGDIVVYRERASGTVYLKRVVGAGGDTVQYREGRLWINGELAHREPLAGAGFTDEVTGVTAAVYRETLPGGVSHLIAEATDSGGSDDSPVYEVPEGSYFMLGDNRDNSRDSRHMGPVPARDIIGHIEYRLWDGRAGKFAITRPE